MNRDQRERPAPLLFTRTRKGGVKQNPENFRLRYPLNQCGASIPVGVNKLYSGDNLTVLRNQIERESVDLIYLDPPFNRQANYNVLFKSQTGEQSHAQIEAFEDTWHWSDEAECLQPKSDWEYRGVQPYNGRF